VIVKIQKVLPLKEKLNLGSGEFKKSGYINLDVSRECAPDVVHDLEVFPYPFHDNQFDIIEADHVLEHLSEPFRVMKELNRILNSGGKLVIRVPHFSRAMSHPQHKRGFDITFPRYFDETFPGGFTGVSLKCEKMRLHWFAQRSLMKKCLSPRIYYLSLWIGKFIDFFANLFPLFCSRIWCFWVGGFYEAEFVFRKP
jgi:SAM-dependent methyltransferase